MIISLNFLSKLIFRFQFLLEKEQTNGEDRDILTDAYFNICELLFQRIEYGDDNSNYLYKAIEYFVWLKLSDVRIVMSCLFIYLFVCW